MPALTDLNVPIFNITDPALPRTPGSSIPGAKQPEVTHLNFLGPVAGFTAGAAGLVSAGPCVRTFGAFYPISGKGPYELASGSPGLPLDR